MPVQENKRGRGQQQTTAAAPAAAPLYLPLPLLWTSLCRLPLPPLCIYPCPWALDQNRPHLPTPPVVQAHPARDQPLVPRSYDWRVAPSHGVRRAGLQERHRLLAQQQEHGGPQCPVCCHQCRHPGQQRAAGGAGGGEGGQRRKQQQSAAGGGEGGKAAAVGSGSRQQGGTGAAQPDAEVQGWFPAPLTHASRPPVFSLACS